MSEENSLEAATGDVARRWNSARRESVLLDRLKQVREEVRRSRVTDVPSQVVEITRRSFLYNWLTKEPDPDVIVIDLRETVTVGPIIRALDYGIDRFAPYWETSKLRQCVVFSSSLVARGVQDRLGQRLGQILEPPAPSTNDDSPDTER